jgi:tripartite-type tricarboxylate transporter receptor subunit TctC
MTERMGQPVVVENKAGANGVVAAQALTGAPRDGYTLIVTDGSMFSINPFIYKNLGYDAKKDFVFVSLAARAPLYLAVNSKSNLMTMQDVIKEAKANPGKLTYGSSGVGSTHHLSHEAMNLGLGISITHVPFKGTGQSVPALVGGQIDMLFSAIPQIGGFVKGGQLRLLTNNSPKRSVQEPQVATLAEGLIPNFDFSPKVGFMAATGTPQAVIDRISAEIVAIAKLPEVQQTLGNVGVEPVGTTQAEYNRIMALEIERFSKAVQAAKIQPE